MFSWGPGGIPAIATSGAAYRSGAAKWWFFSHKNRQNSRKSVITHPLRDSLYSAQSLESQLDRLGNLQKGTILKGRKMARDKVFCRVVNVAVAAVLLVGQLTAAGTIHFVDDDATSGNDCRTGRSGYHAAGNKSQ